MEVGFSLRRRVAGLVLSSVERMSGSHHSKAGLCATKAKCQSMKTFSFTGDAIPTIGLNSIHMSQYWPLPWKKRKRNSHPCSQRFKIAAWIIFSTGGHISRLSNLRELLK